MVKTLNVQEFFKMFPDDDTCLAHLMERRYGGTQLTCVKCGKTGNFTKLSSMPAYSCPWCGDHIHPMVGTPFERSSTPLQKWFYAMYLFTTSRHGVPAKELQRQLGVTYKTAWRIGHEIRKYMGKVDGNGKLGGTVEADETYIGGTKRGSKKAGRGALGKTIVLGMAERGGSLMTKVIPNAKKATIRPLMLENIKRGSNVHTDEWVAYEGLRCFKHETINHGQKEYVRGNVHTNSIEGFWAQLKRSINGTHVHVSGKHLDKYLGEFEFRYNLRKTPHLMFLRLLEAF